MQDAIEGEIVTQPSKKKSIFESHSSYLSSVWMASYVIAGAYSFFSYIWQLFASAQDGIIPFAITFIFSFVITAITGLIAAIVLFVVFFLISVIPYLIIRGLVKS